MQNTMCSIREATSHDEDVLWQMLYEAAHIEDAGESLDDAKNNPDLAKYVAGWGRSYDLGFIACLPDSGQAIGAAWVRLLTADNKGYGYVDEMTPELAMGVVPPWRGRGIGTALLRRAIEHAKEKHSGICLSVRSDNPAVRLYKRNVFIVVPNTEMMKRVGGISYTMLLRF